MQPETLAMIAEGRAPKGDVLAAARIAGIMAAKRTSDLIPLCHPLALTHVAVELEPTPTRPAGIAITATAETDGKTGVEMEALTAASVAALTLYDMCKAVDRGMAITGVRLLSKEGGAVRHLDPTRRHPNDRRSTRAARQRRLRQPLGAQDRAQDSAATAARSCSTAASRATRTRATGTARSRCSRRSPSRRCSAKGLDVGPGDFAENITTEGIDLMTLPVGTTCTIGDDVVSR